MATAYVDESRRDYAGRAVYILGAVIVEPSDETLLRDRMRGLLRLDSASLGS